MHGLNLKHVSDMTTLVKLGPAGKSSSNSCTAWDETRKITHILISYETAGSSSTRNIGCIRSLQFHYQAGGVRGNSPVYGKHDSDSKCFTMVYSYFQLFLLVKCNSIIIGTDCITCSINFNNKTLIRLMLQIKLDGASEYITGLNGRIWCEEYPDEKWISLLTIETNKRKYGPFGNSPRLLNRDPEFNFQFGPSNQFGGFHSTFGNPGSRFTRLTSIGVYVKP
ncbi:uncharacterized protein LOC110697385 [Chenopodium quinoa]|uniref:uncharacterized protein LOC110697385 n=1 Tax=Chenopodium quinoa TaxID=63459 RepID=UPI000B77BDBB|nr:uncharacterized protein LOC110697385 [Chenopodium quinoa]